MENAIENPINRSCKGNIEIDTLPLKNPIFKNPGHQENIESWEFKYGTINCCYKFAKALYDDRYGCGIFPELTFENLTENEASRKVIETLPLYCDRVYGVANGYLLCLELNYKNRNEFVLGSYYDEIAFYLGLDGPKRCPFKRISHLTNSLWKLKNHHL